MTFDKKEYGKLYRKKMKYKIFDHYSNGKNCCACCGENEKDFLTIDHVAENGAEHRKQIGRASDKLHNWLIKNNFPAGYQILCFNCNCARSYRGKGTCPHVTRMKEEMIQ